MATVKISGVNDNLFIDNLMARKVADDKRTMTAAQQKDIWIDLGVWQGYLSKISSITFEQEYTSAPTEDFNRPLTPQEKLDHAAMMKRVRGNLEEKGIIRPRQAEPVNNKNCLICTKHLIGDLKYYCSGTCMEKAKKSGLYDSEKV